MNYKLLTLLLFVSIPVKAKYSIRVFNTPCDQITIKVSSCKPYTFNNHNELNKEQRQNKKVNFLFRGSLVTGNVLKREPIKCHDKQKVNLTQYRKTKLQKLFFINSYKCESKNKIVKTIKPKLLCDTPGASSIYQCFISKYSSKNKFTYTRLTNTR